jgi:N-acetylmuramoyl-L-alanine amidase
MSNFSSLIKGPLGMNITTRSAWGSKQTNVQNLVGSLPIVYIHHTAGYYPHNVTEEINQMKTLQHIAIDIKKYSDIDYNWVIGPSGTVYEARGFGKKSGATLDQNNVSRSVCLMGNFQTDVPTIESLQSVVDMINLLVKEGDLVGQRQLEIFGHRDNPQHPNATACPGNNLYAQLPSIRIEVMKTQPPVPGDVEMKSRFLRQKGYVNVFHVGNGYPCMHVSGEFMDSLLQEDPTIPKIFFDNMAAFKAMCNISGVDSEDPSSAVPGGPPDHW